jgi:hypothetical protein
LKKQDGHDRHHGLNEKFHDRLTDKQQGMTLKRTKKKGH